MKSARAAAPGDGSRTAIVGVIMWRNQAPVQSLAVLVEGAPPVEADYRISVSDLRLGILDSGHHAFVTGTALSLGGVR